MNGASAGAGGEVPLVYQAWRGSNVSAMPFSFVRSPSFPLLRLWICAFLRRRLKITVSSWGPLLD
jgi:hypothetical protein